MSLRFSSGASRSVESRFSSFTIRHQSADAAFRRHFRSAKSAAASASLRSVLRDVPSCARIVKPTPGSSTTGAMHMSRPPEALLSSVALVLPNCSETPRSPMMIVRAEGQSYVSFTFFSGYGARLL